MFLDGGYLMSQKSALIEVFAAVWHRLEPFVPGILGAAVAQAEAG